MAKKNSEQVQLESINPHINKPRLVKLIIKNYRCIGPKPVEIDLDDVVVLVGSNNVGKSSILKAYELAMSQGSGKSKLSLEDFPNNKVDPSNPPEIEVQTVVYDDTVGARWIKNLSNKEHLVREKWVWEDIGEPKRLGWDTTMNQGQGGWSNQVPWGAPNVANSRRPEPHRVEAFSSPDNQAKVIKNLLSKALTDRVKNIGEDENHKSDYVELLEKVKGLQKNILIDAQEEIDNINKELTTIIEKVFPGYLIDFDAKPEEELDKALSLFKSDPQLLMGPHGGHLSTIDRQGSGARRTLLWAAIKCNAENNRKAKTPLSTRPHLLLIDEPEICLHPNAIRDACTVLYELPSSQNWQVMITTHSPIFIDLSKDNTTVVRVEKTSDGTIQGTTVFRPDKARLDDDDKANLKILNLCDPYVSEFFFGGRIVIVEGDTEFTAFNYIKAQMPDQYRDVHIIRARGKATIKSLVKILNHFGSNYSVLHDSDRPRTDNGARKNPAWSTNSSILSEVQKHRHHASTRLLASVPNFEEAFLETKTSKEKPYAALQSISKDPALFSTVEQLLNSLLDFRVTPPKNCLEWDDINQLTARVTDNDLP